MSASPQASQAVKRPLEDASSPSRNDQPEAKRPALDKIVKDAQDVTAEGAENEGDNKGDALDLTASNDAAATNGNHDNNGNHVAKLENGHAKDEHGDTVVHDAPAENKIAIVSGPASMQSNNAAPQNSNDETAWIHVRACISSPEAATIIGKNGENVQKIRQMSHAKCTISDYQKGAVERILTVSGVVDAVAKAFGLIVRTVCNEPLDQPSNGLSKTYPLRLLIPSQLIGSIIGKQGTRIKEIQEASGAKLTASDHTLPASSERSLLIMGVADAVHIATYYVGSTLLEQLNRCWGGPAASAYATRSGGPAGGVPGGLNVVPYVPQNASGHYGSRDHYHNRRPDHRSHHHMPPNQPYGQQYGHPHQAQPGPAMAPQYGGQPAGGYAGAGPHMPQHHGAHAGAQAHAAGPHGQPIPAGAAVPGTPLTQQIFIPNDMVGAIIGKGGQKINEIRQVSGSVIKINEPQDNSNERLVTITGTEECNRMALYMLYSRLESEKHRI